MSETIRNELTLISALPVFNCVCPVVGKENADFENLISLAVVANSEENTPIKIPDDVETSDQFVNYHRPNVIIMDGACNKTRTIHSRKAC